MTTPTADLVQWQRELMETIQRGAITLIDRVVVVPETASTQDAALEQAGGRPGLLLLADRQIAGRGRLGRPWIQGGDLGISATFVLDGRRLPAERLSLGAGDAAALAVEEAIDAALPTGLPRQLVGLRWPNDVVERITDGGGRKLAGVLVEVRAGLALVGVGVNVCHRAEDFPEHLRGRAVSIQSLVRAVAPDATADRLTVACALLRAFDAELRGGDPLAEWRRRDVLAGTQRTFVYEGRAYTGRVEAIDPLNLITIVTSDGERVRLPALTTSLVHE
jgi:BirA family transcriptional regulator, biotin operon repressor / biotin---[acetyl-CoA-carboxylase] ligase